MSEHYATFAEHVPSPLRDLMEARDRRVFRRVASLLPRLERERVRIVEIGPGAGAFAARCRASGWDYLGIEAARGSITALRGRGLEIVEGRVPPLPPLAEKADAVYAAHVIEHLQSGFEVAELLAGCREALATGGRIILVYPSAPIWGALFWEADYSHHWPASERRIRQVAADVGLLCRHAENRTLGYSGLRGALIAGAGRLIPWRLSLRMPPAIARALTGMRILLMPESIIVLEVPGEAPIEESPRD